MLQDLGYETREVDPARVAHAMLLDGEKFDLIVTDHLMPGMSEADLALAIHRHWPTVRTENEAMLRQAQHRQVLAQISRTIL